MEKKKNREQFFLANQLLALCYARDQTWFKRAKNDQIEIEKLEKLIEA